MKPNARFVACFSLILASHSPLGAQTFSKDIAPLFARACAPCHAGKSPASNFSIATFAAVVKGGKGGAAFTAGKASESRLLKFLDGRLQPQMPPGNPLKPAQIQLVKRWIDSGAPEGVPSASAAPSSSGTPYRARFPAPVTALAFSPDSKAIAVGTYRMVQFWSVESPKQTGAWTGHPDAVRSLAWTKDGKRLAAGGGVAGSLGEARIWDHEKRAEQRVLSEQTDAVQCVQFSPDESRLLSASADKTLRAYDLATGKAAYTVRDHTDAIWGAAISQNGARLVTCSADKSVKVWDGATGRRKYTAGAHDDAVLAIALRPDGNRAVTASADKTAKVWDLGDSSGGLARALGGHSASVNAVAWSADSRWIATASGDKTARIWNQDDGSVRHTLTGATDWLYSVAFSPDGKRVAAGSWDGKVYLWSLEDGKLQAMFETFAPAKSK